MDLKQFRPPRKQKNDFSIGLKIFPASFMGTEVRAGKKRTQFCSPAICLNPVAIFKYPKNSKRGGHPFFFGYGVCLFCVVVGYRSGQTGQTVNLLALPSKVRILPPPPFFKRTASAAADAAIFSNAWKN
jgi:hypothetical protein